MYIFSKHNLFFPKHDRMAAGFRMIVRNGNFSHARFSKGNRCADTSRFLIKLYQFHDLNSSPARKLCWVATFKYCTVMCLFWLTNTFTADAQMNSLEPPRCCFAQLINLTAIKGDHFLACIAQTSVDGSFWDILIYSSLFSLAKQFLHSL